MAVKLPSKSETKIDVFCHIKFEHLRNPKKHNAASHDTDRAFENADFKKHRFEWGKEEIPVGAGNKEVSE